MRAGLLQALLAVGCLWLAAGQTPDLCSATGPRVTCGESACDISISGALQPGPPSRSLNDPVLRMTLWAAAHNKRQRRWPPSGKRRRLLCAASASPRVRLLLPVQASAAWRGPRARRWAAAGRLTRCPRRPGSPTCTCPSASIPTPAPAPTPWARRERGRSRPPVRTQDPPPAPLRFLGCLHAVHKPRGKRYSRWFRCDAAALGAPARTGNATLELQQRTQPELGPDVERALLSLEQVAPGARAGAHV